jgi:hypothetical protein
MTPADATHLIPEALFALRTRPGDKAPPVDKALLEQLNFFAKAANYAPPFRDKPLVSETVTVDKQEVKFFKSDALPPGLRPAFALRDGFLLLAGTPDLITRFTAPGTATGDGPAPLVRVSFKAWRAFIQDRRAALAKMLVEKEKLTPDDAAERIDGVLSVLAFVDRLEVRHQAGKGYAVVSIVVQTAQPLKK